MQVKAALRTAFEGGPRLPPKRVRRMMKQQMPTMVSQDAVRLLCEATIVITMVLTEVAWSTATAPDRRSVLQVRDIKTAVLSSWRFDFLRDVLDIHEQNTKNAAYSLQIPASISMPYLAQSHRSTLARVAADSQVPKDNAEVMMAAGEPHGIVKQRKVQKQRPDTDAGAEPPHCAQLYHLGHARPVERVGGTSEAQVVHSFYFMPPPMPQPALSPGLSPTRPQNQAPHLG